MTAMGNVLAICSFLLVPFFFLGGRGLFTEPNRLNTIGVFAYYVISVIGFLGYVCIFVVVFILTLISVFLSRLITIFGGSHKTSNTKENVRKLTQPPSTNSYQS